jgi:hypothetical protein
MAGDRHQGQQLDRAGEVHDQVEPGSGRQGGPPRRVARLLLLAAAALAATVLALVLGLMRGGDDPPAAVELDRCRGLLAEASRDCYVEEFQRLVAGSDDPRPTIAAIERAVRGEGGFVLSNCHGVMHTVGRTYALGESLTLADLQDVLPRSNDPGCSAGFAHGLVTGVAPSIDPRRPRDAAAVCADAGTRYRRYSCVHGLGHAFMRMYGDRLPPALALCRALGPRAAADCAQGAYHDYWFAVVGADTATLPAGAVADPRILCAAQPAAFVRPCWYRAFVDNRPEGLVVDSAVHLDVLCRDLEGLQREACISGAAVIGPADPEQQLELCAELDDPRDAVACIRGTKAQNLLGASTSAYVRLLGRCELFAGSTKTACYRWLGKAVAVLTDGAFGRRGCPLLEPADARRSCLAGARELESALETFS